jgi:two-component system invasion response regulator UvrY
MITVLVVDKLPVVRCGIRTLAREIDPGIVIAEAGSGSEAVRRVQSDRVDAVVLEIDLPGRDGFDTLHQIRNGSAHPPPVLVFSRFPEADYGLRALRAGAAGFLHKTAPPDEVVNAIRMILRGHRYVGRELAETLAAHLSGRVEPKPHHALSDREFQVFRMLASGQRNSQIACQLSLSLKTVQTHRTRILHKLGLHTDSELATYAFKHGLLPSRRQGVDEHIRLAGPSMP